MSPIIAAIIEPVAVHNILPSIWVGERESILIKLICLALEICLSPWSSGTSIIGLLTMSEGGGHTGWPWPVPERLLLPCPSVPLSPSGSPHCWCTVFPIGFPRKLLEKHFWPPLGLGSGRGPPLGVGTHLWPGCGGWSPGTCCAGASCSPHCTRPAAAPRAGCPGTPGSRCTRCAGTPAGSAPSPPGRWPRTWGRGGQVRTRGPLFGECLPVPGTVPGRCQWLAAHERVGICKSLQSSCPAEERHTGWSQSLVSLFCGLQASLWTSKNLCFLGLEMTPALPTS